MIYTAIVLMLADSDGRSLYAQQTHELYLNDHRLGDDHTRSEYSIANLQYRLALE